MLRTVVLRALQLVRRAPPKLVLALGWAAVVLYAYPGQMTDASFAHLRQARIRLGGDAGMAALWRLCEVFVAGPSGMLFLQAALFVLGAHVLVRRVLSPCAAAWTTAALTVFPPVIASLSVISTHTMMASWLLVGVAGISSERPRARLAGLGALVIATAVQPAALVATLPLLLGFLVSRNAGRAHLQALLAWLAISAVAFGADAALGRGRLQAWNFARAGTADVQRPGIAEQLGLSRWGTERVQPVSASPELALKAGVPTRTSELQDLARSGVALLAGYTPLFMPTVYLLVALALVAASRGHRDVRAIALSGASVQLFMLFTATSLHYPQTLWLVVCACLGSVLFLARRART